MQLVSSAAVIHVSASALQAQQARIDAVAHNLANIGSPGFKRVHVVATDLRYDQLTPATGGAITVEDLLQGTGTASIPTARSFRQGTLERTGRELDVAIDGDGFLVARNADGRLVYTRDGALGVDASGRLVTSSGRPLVPEVVLPAGARVVTITSDGQVLAATGEGEPVAIGQLQMVRFSNPSGLQPVGDNLFIATPAAGEPIAGSPGQDGLGTLVAQTLERANVDVAEEIVTLIQAQRAYQLSLRSLQAADEMLALADGIGGQV